MPKAYVAMRDKFHREGMPMKKAKAKAAKIYNASHKKPVTRSYDEEYRKKFSK